MTHRLSIFFLVLVVGFVGGIVVEHNNHAVRRLQSLYKPLRADEPNVLLAEIPCRDLAGPRTEAILVLGQSNAENIVPGHLLAPLNVYSFYKGGCYPVSEPIPGIAGAGSNVMTRVARGLIGAGAADRVVLIPATKHGRKAAEWLEGGEAHASMIGAIDGSKAAGLVVTRVIWMQGETDAAAGTDPAAYTAVLRRIFGILRQRGIRAPIHVMRQTLCGPTGSAAIKGAQEAAAGDGVFVGPDLDVLGPDFRYDGCHFSDRGADEAADLIVAGLMER